MSVGSVVIGGDHPVVIQSMAATRTRDVAATITQVRMLWQAGASIVRVAADSAADCEALAAVRRAVPDAVLSVDLQENWSLAPAVAAHVHKIRYNPGHLHHLEPGRSDQDKVRMIADAASRHGVALRVGVNCGSVDPRTAERFGPDHLSAMVESAAAHCRMLDELGFDRYVVSLKDSDPANVFEANRRFAEIRPDVPLHLGVTEAGLPPEGIAKTRRALEPLLRLRIGETLRVSLTVPADRKFEEIEAARAILDDVCSGRVTPAEAGPRGVDIVSCPGCSRVENERFVELATRIREMTRGLDLVATVAVMGCRVNGPGETDDADLGLWCAPSFVNLKRGTTLVGSFPYETVLERFGEELERLAASRGSGRAPRS